MPGAEVASAVVVGLAFIYLGVISVLLVVIDVRTHRLPNRVVLPSYLVSLTLFAAASALLGEGGALMRAGAGMAILFASYLAMRLINPSSLGGGDVKLAGLLGIYFGWVGWGAILIGTAAAFLIGGTQALIMLALRRGDRRTRIAFGPAMLLGGWAAMGILMVPGLVHPASLG